MTLDVAKATELSSNNTIILSQGVLYRHDSQGVPKPELADSMTPSADGMTNTLKLKAGLKWRRMPLQVTRGIRDRDALAHLADREEHPEKAERVVGSAKRRAPAPDERRRRQPGFRAAREIEFRRHDADDDDWRRSRVGIEAHGHGATDHGSIASEPPDPQSLADEHRARSRPDFVRRYQPATEKRRGPDNPEERGRDG